MAKLFQYNFQQYESLSNFIRALLRKNTQNPFFNDFDLRTDLRIEAGSTTTATCKMEVFATIVNNFQPLSIAVRSSILNMTAGIYSSTLTNVRLWKKIEFYKGKSNCEAIVVASWGQWQRPGGFSGSKSSKLLRFSLPLRWLNGLQWHLKKLYPWSKELYQFIGNLFFLANIPSPAQVKHHAEKDLTSSCLCSWWTGVTERYLLLQYYPHKKVQPDKAQKNNSAVSCTYRRNKYNFISIRCFSFKIKQKDLIV